MSFVRLLHLNLICIDNLWSRGNHETRSFKCHIKKYLNKKRKRMHWIDLNSFYEYFDYESWEDNEREVDIY